MEGLASDSTTMIGLISTFKAIGTIMKMVPGIASAITGPRMMEGPKAVKESSKGEMEINMEEVQVMSINTCHVSSRSWVSMISKTVFHRNFP